MSRYIFIICGCVAVGLGTLGIVLPGLPTTPFILLASWCFYKSSPRLRKKLLDSFLGSYIREYRRAGGLSIGRKIGIILLMAAMVGVSVTFFLHTMTLKAIVGAAGVIGCIVVAFVVPNVRKDE